MVRYLLAHILNIDILISDIIVIYVKYIRLISVLESLEGAVRMLEESPSVSYEDNIALAILTNGLESSLSRFRHQDVIERLKSYNVNLAFIGITPGSSAYIADLFDEYKDEYPVTYEPFENALNMVSYFAPKPKAIRGQPFQLQLSESFKIDLQLFVKVSEEKFIPKFNQVTDNNEHVSKIRQYEQVVNEVNIDEGGNSEAKTVTVGKGDIIKGYHYGTSIIPFSKADKELAAVEKEGKQLQLVMFTKEENILPHYLMSSCRWLIPNKKSESAARATKALVEALKKQGKVAIVRYAYNAVSNPRLAVLFPKVTKNGCPVFEHFLLPFNEDFRGFDFPPLEKVPDASDYQNDTVETYIDHFMLTDEIKNEEGEKEKTERMKINEIRNPQPQQVCMSLRKKILGLPPELSEDEHKALLNTVSTPKDLVNSSEKIMKVLAKSFDLKIVERPKEAGILNKPLSTFKLDFEDMKPPASYDDMDLDMFNDC